MEARVGKLGRRWAIFWPRDAFPELGLSEKTQVRVEVRDGRLILTPIRKPPARPRARKRTSGR